MLCEGMGWLLKRRVEEKNAHRISKKSVFLPPISKDDVQSSYDGALAQLARAFDWQSRGREFDSHTLHKKGTCDLFRGCFFV